MSSMSPFWVYLLQVLLVVHVLKTGRNRYWILMLLFLPMIGGLAYLLVEILPELSGSIGGQRARRSLAGIVNPGAQLRRLAAAWEQTPNTDNARHYAAALLETGQHAEAEQVIDQALAGLFSTEPNLMLLKARLKFDSGDAGAAARLLDELQAANPGFRSADGHLLLARALEASGQLERALREYRAVAGYYPGVEARYRHALALEQSGQDVEARAELEQIIKDARLAPAHFRKAQANWLRRAKAALK